ncbi:hypothetical protein MGM1_1560 [Candidatus Malacoplasma girerdii]|uniref:Uncharacterized protein n=1 Tax=Candidatus Malacoplasma girerdii TaxID=1318617 RepID=A0A097SSH2_9BACT|nr:hypothetical protein MGM1_1560 [Candidatus Malacoplasma girerdii]ASJ89093.1 MAG: hypothetical protein B1217_0199 [Candidatus Malacoplasma girerdii]
MILNKNNSKDLKEIFAIYRICKVKLLALKKLRINDKLTKQMITNYRNYVNYIDEILKNLTKNEQEFIKQVYLENCSIDETGYSVSGYYNKIKTVNELFSLYFDSQLCPL